MRVSEEPTYILYWVLFLYCVQWVFHFPLVRIRSPLSRLEEGRERKELWLGGGGGDGTI
jgi:hypothetical protein